MNIGSVVAEKLDGHVQGGRQKEMKERKIISRIIGNGAKTVPNCKPSYFVRGT